MLAGHFADRHDGGVSDLALDGDGVEALPQVIEAPDAPNAVTATDLFLDDGGHHERPETGLTEHGREGCIVELGDDLGSQVASVEPGVQRAPQRRGGSG